MEELALEIEKMVTGSPASISGTKAFGKSWILTCGEILNIYGNIQDGDFEEKIDTKKLKSIQFARKFVVNENTFRKLNNSLLSNQNLQFSMTFNWCGAFNDLQFLKHLPELKNFNFDTFSKIDVAPIRDYVQLNHLGLAGYNISLQPIEANPHFRSFGLGEKIKDFKTISSFSQLEKLTITGQSLKNIDFISPLKKLKQISFRFGGTKFFDDLATVESLEELEIWRTRQLEVEHLVPLNKIKNLRILKLRELPRIAHMNWFNNPTVETLVLDGLKSLKTFDSLKEMPHLKKLVIINWIDDNGLLSLHKLDNVNNIQIFEEYLGQVSMFDNHLKFSRIDFKYLL